MPASPARLPILLLAAALAACGSNDPNAFAPPCPQPVIAPDTGDLTLYRPTGHDVTDLQLNARVEGIDGNCKPGGRDRLAARLTVGFRIARGPAASGRVFDLPYFVAVTRGDQILDEHFYTLHVEFPGNVETVDLRSEPVDLLLPTPPGTPGTAYRVLAGFRLTPAQLQQNRARATQ
jgi:hypothetical protein